MTRVQADLGRVALRAAARKARVCQVAAPAAPKTVHPVVQPEVRKVAARLGAVKPVAARALRSVFPRRSAAYRASAFPPRARGEERVVAVLVKLAAVRPKGPKAWAVQPEAHRTKVFSAVRAVGPAAVRAALPVRPVQLAAVQQARWAAVKPAEPVKQAPWGGNQAPVANPEPAQAVWAKLEGPVLPVEWAERSPVGRRPVARWAAMRKVPARARKVLLEVCPVRRAAALARAALSQAERAARAAVIRMPDQRREGVVATAGRPAVRTEVPDR